VHTELLLVAGLGAGLLAGMLGVGGGILMMPALLYVAGLDQRHAVATSLAAMVPLSLAAAWRQHRYGNLDVRTGVSLGVLGTVGAAVGVSLTEVIPQRLLQIGFALLMLFVAAQMIRSLFKPPAGSPTASESD